MSAPSEKQPLCLCGNIYRHLCPEHVPCSASPYARVRMLAYALLHEMGRDLTRETADLRREVERAMAVLIPMVDIGQRRLNGGPYCIHVEGDGFCGRAQAWDGHHLGANADWPGHVFVDGEWLYEAALAAMRQGA